MASRRFATVDSIKMAVTEHIKEMPETGFSRTMVKPLENRARINTDCNHVITLNK